ncbi:MAG: amino acid ABC transporter ATP-binding protein, partial [Limnochordia bacterium]
MLKLRGVTKRYHKTVALDGLDLDVAPGERVVIMGPSGCGKSTAIRCINRLTEPDAGQILFQGQDVLGMGHRELLAMRKKIGFVFQHFNLIGRLTAVENTMFGLVMGGMARQEAYERAMEALTKVGLADIKDKRPSELSGGQQQRIGIARALALDPQLMLWDEPTASLDPILVGEVLEVMEGLVATTKTTMVIVTHEVAFARRAADRVVLMDGG